jgi:hypothetical protein
MLLFFLLIFIFIVDKGSTYIAASIRLLFGDFGED